jgi:hypothetical protein
LIRGKTNEREICRKPAIIKVSRKILEWKKSINKKNIEIYSDIMNFYYYFYFYVLCGKIYENHDFTGADFGEIF